MKKLRFNFNHPVIGHVCLVPLKSLKGICQRFKVTSADDNTLEIPVTNCHEGKWKLTLNWEYDGKNFSFNEEFEIPCVKSK